MLKSLAIGAAVAQAAPQKNVFKMTLPKDDWCTTCIQTTGQSINELLNYLIQVGVPGECSYLCDILPSADQGICNLVCDLVGIQAFINALQNADLDPIYFCEILNVCKPGPDNAAAKINKVSAQPVSVAVGGTVKFYLDFTVINATGVGEIAIDIEGGQLDPGSMGGTFINEGFTPGHQGMSVALQIQNDPGGNPPVVWSPGNYTFEYALCQGECFSKHPHSKVFGTMTGTFNVVGSGDSFGSSIEEPEE